MLVPIVKVEHFPVIGDIRSPESNDITDFVDISIKGGIETTKDTFSFNLPNYMLRNGSTFANYLRKKSSSANRIRTNDDIDIYASYDSFPTNLNDALLMSGTVNTFSQSFVESEFMIGVNCKNQTEEMLQAMTPFSSFKDIGTINQPSTIIKQMIKRINAYNPKRKVYAYLDTETNPFTGSPGLIQNKRSDATNFPTIDFNVTWKPVYINVETLSTPEYTNDAEAGVYIFGFKRREILPEFYNTLGSTITKFFWENKSTTSAGSFNLEEDFTKANFNFNIDGVKNMFIVNAGTDLKGAGITGVAYNLDSMGEAGPKTDYYTKARRTFSLVLANEINIAGSFQGPGGYPTTDEEGTSTAIPWLFQFSARDIFGGPTGAPLTATSDQEFNQFLRDESRWQAVLEANEVLKHLGEPLPTLDSTLLIGSNTLQGGELIDLTIKPLGWEGTETNPSKKLRLMDIGHAFNANGWTTTYKFKEDEKILAEKFN